MQRETLLAIYDLFRELLGLAEEMERLLQEELEQAEVEDSSEAGQGLGGARMRRLGELMEQRCRLLETIGGLESEDGDVEGSVTEDASSEEDSQPVAVRASVAQVIRKIQETDERCVRLAMALQQQGQLALRQLRERRAAWRGYRRALKGAPDTAFVDLVR